MIVNCDKHICKSNIAGECINISLCIKKGICQSMEQDESTGEVIDCESNNSMAIMGDSSCIRN